VRITCSAWRTHACTRTKLIYLSEVACPLRLEELLEGRIAPVPVPRLEISESNGSPELCERSRSSWSRCPGRCWSQRRSEANYTASGAAGKATHTAVMLPNYLQTWAGSCIRQSCNAFTLWSEWKAPGCAGADVDSLKRRSSKTRMIVVTNPITPGPFSRSSGRDIRAAASQSGAFGG